MTTKTAQWNPKYQLLDRAWTKKWTLPQNGRSLKSQLSARGHKGVRASFSGRFTAGTDPNLSAGLVTRQNFPFGSRQRYAAEAVQLSWGECRNPLMGGYRAPRGD